MAEPAAARIALLVLLGGLAGPGDALAQPAGAPASAASAAAAPAATLTAANPALEARMFAITNELRCLVCQNQTIAESHADLAVDLRQEVRELLARGQDEAQIRDYMTARYGDFILYRPPLKPTTWLLWLGPAALLAIALFALVVTIVRRGRLADDRFEPDPAWDTGADGDAVVRAEPALPPPAPRHGRRASPPPRSSA